MFDSTIAVISTALSQGAISIVRVSGDQAIEIVQKIFSRDIRHVPSHTIHYGYILDDDKEVVDEVFGFCIPWTQNIYHRRYCRNQLPWRRIYHPQILSLVLSHGATMAKPGEFTQRAFYHGRIDLSQAEAVEDMIEASNDTASHMAIQGIQGSVKKKLFRTFD